MSAKPINPFELSKQSLLALYITFTNPSEVHGPQVKKPCSRPKSNGSCTLSVCISVIKRDRKTY